MGARLGVRVRRRIRAGTRAASVARARIDADRARRGCSGALNPQSALAGLNSFPRGNAPVAPPHGASMARVPRGVGL
jgi:hypothetical protein